MGGLDGRYNWHEDADPADAEFLAGSSSLEYLPDGQTAVAYVGIYDDEGEALGDVGVYVSDLPNGLGTVYRVEVEDGRIVDLDSGSGIHEAWVRARDDYDVQKK
jgi:hypothetical protein